MHFIQKVKLSSIDCSLAFRDMMNIECANKLSRGEDFVEGVMVRPCMWWEDLSGRIRCGRWGVRGSKGFEGRMSVPSKES
jgi:hypothetical protein